ncbi:hypothetical protein QQZ08_009350 [Neonectria magnoliae]|uniref:C2H2-type domain-containing protein n=1 Tax=Neonectria magnoliae TaxID=2732573 RepID=A0ABR1HPK9_9HYPO
MIGLWNQYAEEHNHPSPYDLKSLKDFVKEIAFGINGAEDDPNPGEGTIMIYWKQFMAGWHREHDAIPRNTTLSVTNFIKYELPEILKREGNIKLVKNKRLRRFGTKNHFLHLGRQLWENDWIEYEKPATRVYDWADFMAIVCSSARIGEYIESTCRAGSGRGLYYKDVKFGVFRNEHGNAEFAIQLVRDAKGMTHTPDKRPEHSIYEGLGPMPLICNAMLPILAILIAAKAFSGYDTIEDLLALEPSEGEMIHLQWRDSILEQPLFKSMSSRGTPGRIETANAVSKRLRALGFRAGMKHAGQKDPNTYNNHYQPNNSGTDSQGSYFGTEVRTVVNDLFRGLTVARNPQLLQSLPAEKKEALRTSPELAAIEEELATLRGQRDQDSVSRRKKLHADKRTLENRELRKWQKAQSHGPSTTRGDNGLPCYHRSIFNRVRFLMPERDRLAVSLFETDTLRSATGLRALRDMIALCEADAEVEFRPGLEPDLCQCADSTRRRKLPRSGRLANDAQSTYDWRHVYNCFKKSQSGFVELCFLCHEWVVGELQWSDHCRSHLACPEALPIQCDPLMYGGVLATAGYCVFCMADPSLAPDVRLRQFLDKGSWRDHVHGHYKIYVRSVEDGEPTVCPHPNLRCDGGFDSAKHLEFHLLGVHCPDFVEESSVLEVLTQDDDVTPPKKKRQRIVEATGNVMKAESECYFVDETIETIRRHLPSDASIKRGWSEYEAVQNVGALSSQPSPICSGKLETAQTPPVPALEHLTYTSLPELLASSDSTESTPGITWSGDSDINPFDLSEFMAFPPTPKPELSASPSAACDSQGMLVDNISLMVHDDPSGSQNTRLLSSDNSKDGDGKVGG